MGLRHESATSFGDLFSYSIGVMTENIPMPLCVEKSIMVDCMGFKNSCNTDYLNEGYYKFYNY